MEDSNFKRLYSSIDRLFTQPDILYSKGINDYICRWLYYNKEIGITTDYDIIHFKYYDISISIIRSPKDEFVCDTIFNVSMPHIIFVVPMSICYIENDDTKVNKTIDYIYNIFDYICNYSLNKFCFDKKSSLYKVFSIAPVIMTIHILSRIYNLYSKDFDKYIPVGNKNKHFNINQILDHSIEDLLDYGGVLGVDIFKE